MFKGQKLVVAFVALSLVFGCQGKKTESEAEKPATEEVAEQPATQSAEPDHIVVQHILIGFEGSVPGKPITRTRAEAETLANELFARATGGEDFDALVQQYTDDAYPGIYKMANFGVEANVENQVFPRDRMVPAFGDVGFPLAVGGIAIAAHDSVKSPYGWHVVKRVE